MSPTTGPVGAGQPHASWDFAWNVPNILTLIRLASVPVFAWMLLAHPDDQVWRIATTAVFLAAIITDSFDGWYARKYNMITNFGKLWDSIADKALTGMGFIGLSILGELPWWMTIIILAREWGITAMRFVVLKYGVMSANRGGKLKTIMQAVALPMFLLWWPDAPLIVEIVRWGCMIIAFALTVVTGMDYIREAVRLRRAALAAGGPVDISQIRNAN